MATRLPKDYTPSEKEPFMNAKQKEFFKRKLLAWRSDIIQETKETLNNLQKEVVNFSDLADRASSETDRSLELRARDRQRKLISKIDEALLRIEDGAYGYCEDTGESIGLKRLDCSPHCHPFDRLSGAPREKRKGLSRRLVLVETIR